MFLKLCLQPAVGKLLFLQVSATTPAITIGSIIPLLFYQSSITAPIIHLLPTGSSKIHSVVNAIILANGTFLLSDLTEKKRVLVLQKIDFFRGIVILITFLDDRRPEDGTMSGREEALMDRKYCYKLRLNGRKRQKIVKHKDILTTGQVAQICHVAPRTVTKWFDAGQLKGYRIPGSRDRRILFSELIRFMKAHDMPTESLETRDVRVLLIDSRVELARQLSYDLESRGGFDVQIAHNSFDAGRMAQKLRPNFILIDLMSPEIDAYGLCSYAHENEELADCCVIALAGGLTETEAQSLLQKGFGGVVTEPTNIHKVLACIQEKCSILC